jgi:hypothetical protein
VKRPDAAASSDNMAMIADLRTGAIPMTAFQGKEFLVTEPSSLAVLPASGLPAQSRFQAHAADVVDRAFALWSTVAGRNAALTASLLAREADEGEATPAGSTVRRGAVEASWAARADADLLQTSARTVAELRAGWLGALSLAQQTLVAGLVGELDDLPHAGAAQLKSAELVLKTLQHAGTTIVPTVTEAAPLVDDPTLSLDQRARRSRARILEANARG